MTENNINNSNFQLKNHRFTNINIDQYIWGLSSLVDKFLLLYNGKTIVERHDVISDYKVKL